MLKNSTIAINPKGEKALSIKTLVPDIARKNVPKKTIIDVAIPCKKLVVIACPIVFT